MGRAFEYRKERKFKRWGAMAKAFTRIGREIAISVKEGGANPETNARLRAAINNSKTANMPKDRVDAAIKRASSKEEKAYEEITYEAYVSEQNLIPDDPNEPVRHPLVDQIFKGKKGNLYFKPAN